VPLFRIVSGAISSELALPFLYLFHNVIDSIDITITFCCPRSASFFQMSPKYGKFHNKRRNNLQDITTYAISYAHQILTINIHCILKLRTSFLPALRTVCYSNDARWPPNNNAKLRHSRIRNCSSEMNNKSNGKKKRNGQAHTRAKIVTFPTKMEDPKNINEEF